VLGFKCERGSKVIDWKSKWFYIENHAPSLPDRTRGPPKTRGEWSTSAQNIFQADELLDWINDIVDVLAT